MAEFMSSNDQLGNVKGTLPWDGTTDWLLDYQEPYQSFSVE
jgi:myb proto-oncogene protein